MFWTVRNLSISQRTRKKKRAKQVRSMRGVGTGRRAKRAKRMFYLSRTLPLVQSLNSPFFPPHIGAEHRSAKSESRITCMRMLRRNQKKFTRPLSTRVHTTLLTSMCRAIPFSARALKKKLFSDRRWYCGKNKLKCGLSLSVLLPTTITHYYSFPKHFFRIVFACWASLQKFLKESLARTSSSFA